MKRHLTKRELIEYRFRLTSDDQVSTSAEHLAGCAECRERLEQLNRKFSALDLLREDIHVSDELVSQVLEQAKRPAPTKVFSFRKYRWIGAVAAVLVVGFALLIGSLTKEVPTQQKFVRGPEAEGRKLHEELQSTYDVKTDSTERMVAKGSRAKVEVPLAEDLASEAVKTKTFAMGVPTEEEPVRGQFRRGMTAGDAGTAVAELISEQPPFAPASAIELVTLPRRDNVQLTIYNSADLTLVRDRRNLTLKKGWNWLQFMWANTLIDPTSLNLEPLAQVSKIDIQQLVFPARLRELGRWLIRSEISGQVPFEITYFTSGLSWRAFYMGTLAQDEKTMRLQGYVRVGNNSGEDYEQAQTRLIVGKVHILDQIAELARRQYPYGAPQMIIEGYKVLADIENGRFADSFAGVAGVRGAGLELRRKEIKKEGLSEYFLYTIEGTETIPNEWGKRLLSFEAEDIVVESLYKYDEERWANQAIRFVKFTNDEEHNLGDTPIPNGTVKIYSQAGQGYLSYVGGTNIKYIPVDEEVELNLGPARLVEVEPKLMDFKTDNYMFDNKGNISGWDEIRTWEIEMTNTRTLPIEVEITRGFSTAYWTLQADIPYAKHDATHARFKLQLEPRTKQAFGYTVRTYHEMREEAFMKQEKGQQNYEQ